MNDQELLENAAKAAGYAGQWDDAWYAMSAGRTGWDPLTNDGDALRLAVKLNLALLFPLQDDEPQYVGAGQVGSMTAAKTEPANPDKCAAVRRAIVRAAAAIGSKQ